MTWRAGRRLCAARALGLRQDHAAQHHLRPRPCRRAGKVLFDGKDVTALSTQQRNIAQVFQFPVIYDTMTVRENLAFPLKNRGLPRAEIEAQACARSLGCSTSRDMLARKAQRADRRRRSRRSRSAAGWCAPTSTAILFDEPLTVIDPHLKWELRSKLKVLHRALRSTR